MIPAGYMFKKVMSQPGWLKAANVSDIYSLSGCLSSNFIDYIKYWKHNGYFLFDSPTAMEEIAKENNLDLIGMTLFYYEVFEKTFDEHTRKWSALQPEMSFHTSVEEPKFIHLEGYDVTTFSMSASPECSPLSCNGLALKVAVNRRCLFPSFEEAKCLLETGKFDRTEPGPFRIFAVYTLDG